MPILKLTNFNGLYKPGQKVIVDNKMAIAIFLSLTLDENKIPVNS